MTILIQNGHVVDPLTKRDEVCDVLVKDGKISTEMLPCKTLESVKLN